MKNNCLLKKTLVVIIVILFVGLIIVPIISSINTPLNTIDNPYYKKAKFNPFKEGWEYRKKITIDHDKIAGNLVNFPILISTIDYDLQDKAQFDGDDILFMNHPGKAYQLYHEIEYYNGDSGELVTWVNIPRLSSHRDTKIYMYYGNPDCSSQEIPEMVWDSNYMAVHHMDDSTPSTIDDSTMNNNSGYKYLVDDPKESELGKAGRCQEHNTDFNYIRLEDDNSLDVGTGDATIEIWLKSTSYFWENFYYSDEFSDYNKISFLKLDAEYNNVGQIFVRGNSWNKYSYARGSTTLKDDKWHYIVCTIDNSQAGQDDDLRLFIDGEEETLSSENHEWDGTTLTNSRDKWIGKRKDVNKPFQGLLDEFRISKFERSDAWIKTTYNTINDPESFANFCSEVTNNNMLLLRILERFPLLQRLLEMWR